MNYAELTDDELRLEVARRCGYRWYRCEYRYGGSEAYLTLPRRTGVLPKGYFEADGPCSSDIVFVKSPNYPRDLTAAIALLDSMTYPPEPDGRRVPVAYITIKETYNILDNINPMDKPRYYVHILSRKPHGQDYEARADTLPRAACEAWLAWMEAQND